ncbi:MAG: hypothetical protein ABF780_05845 [Bifidobacterium aquikefiri]|uniref:hypothetical protein n=1 Tax=Bifidobacterium aquikefiri TaxID=1653207 RepID=UPI001178BC53|nr:hypothetical protein [Bifidobacterium aquikefiri]
MSVALMLGLSSCGGASSAREYSQAGISSAKVECGKKTDELTSVQKNPETDILEISGWYNDLDERGQGTKSALFKCVISRLSIPKSLVKRMEKNDSQQNYADIGNLKISWFRNSIMLTADFGIKETSKNDAEYYATQSIKHTQTYCESESEDGVYVTNKSNYIGIDTASGIGTGSSPYLCVSRALGIDQSITDDINMWDSKQWNVRSGDFYLGWINQSDVLIFVISSEHLK